MSTAIIPEGADDDRAAWEKRPGEGEKPYAAFRAFLDLGPGRTVAAVGRQLGKSGNLIDRWCQRWSWRERAAHYDVDLDRRRRAQAVDDQRAAVARHAKSAQALLGQAARAIAAEQAGDYDPGAVQAGRALLKEALDALEGGDAAQAAEVIARALRTLPGPQARPPDPRALQHAAVAMDKGIHHHRLALGLPTDVKQQDVVLKRTINDALEIQTTLRRIIEETICDDCRRAVNAEIRRVAERQRQLAARLD